MAVHKWGFKEYYFKRDTVSDHSVFSKILSFKAVIMKHLVFLTVFWNTSSIQLQMHVFSTVSLQKLTEHALKRWLKGSGWKNKQQLPSFVPSPFRESKESCSSHLFKEPCVCTWPPVPQLWMWWSSAHHTVFYPPELWGKKISYRFIQTLVVAHTESLT